MSKRIQTVFSDEIFDKLKDIALKKGTTDHKGSINITMTLCVAISDMHAKLFPDYISVQKDRNTITPTQIAEQKIAVESAKDQARINKERTAAIGLCEAIDHSEVIIIDGREYCQYPVYTMSSPHIVDTTIVKEPLSLMNPELIANQYQDIMGNKGAEAKKKIDKVLAKQLKKKEVLQVKN